MSLLTNRQSSMRGSSIVEALVAMGIVALTAWVMETTLRNGVRGANEAEMRAEIVAFVREVESQLFTQLSYLLTYAAIRPADPAPPAYIRCKTSKDHFRRGDSTALYLPLPLALRSSFLSQSVVLRQTPTRLTIYSPSANPLFEAAANAAVGSPRLTEALARCRKFLPHNAWSDLGTSTSISGCFVADATPQVRAADYEVGRHHVLIEARYMLTDLGTDAAVRCRDYASVPEARRGGKLVYSIFMITKSARAGTPQIVVEWHHLFAARAMTQ